MVNKPLSAENAATALNGAELLDGVQAGGNVKITAQQVRDYVLTGPVGIGMTAVEWLDITKNQNAGTKVHLSNNDSGSSAWVEYKLNVTAAVGGIRMFGASYSGTALDLANSTQVYSSGNVVIKSTYSSGAIIFGTNDAEFMRSVVDNGGSHLIGLTASVNTARLQVDQPDAAKKTAFLRNNNATPGAAEILQIHFNASPDNNTAKFLACTDSTTERLRIYSDGDVQNHDNSYGAISGAAIKQDIRDANSQWADVKAFRFRNYKFIADVEAYGDEARELLGVIAEELEQVSPGLVRDDPVFEMVEVEPERVVITKEQRQKLETVSVPVKEVVEIDGKFVLREVMREECRPVLEKVPLYNEDGSLRAEPLLVPVMEEVDVETVIPTKRELREVGTQKRVVYSILCLKAVKSLQEAMVRIEALEAQLAARSVKV